MIELLEANWPIVLVAFLIGLAVAWLIFVRTRKTTITRDGGATEEPGNAKRNQALIDSPPTMATPPSPVPAPSPAPTPTPSPRPQAETIQAAQTANNSADDLSRIKGVGPKLVQLLNANGVTSFAQIAEWSDAEVAEMDAKLGRFAGRITRDDWRKQAKLLQDDDLSAYEASFGKL